MLNKTNKFITRGRMPDSLRADYGSSSNSVVVQGKSRVGGETHCLGHREGYFLCLAWGSLSSLGMGQRLCQHGNAQCLSGLSSLSVCLSGLPSLSVCLPGTTVWHLALSACARVCSCVRVSLFHFVSVCHVWDIMSVCLSLSLCLSPSLCRRRTT